MILISDKNGSAIYVASSPRRIEDRPSGVRGRFPSRPCSARWRDDGIPGDDRIHDRFPQRARSLHEKLEAGRGRTRKAGVGSHRDLIIPESLTDTVPRPCVFTQLRKH